jgi:two-component system chemotaxis response regulator CheY
MRSNYKSINVLIVDDMAYMRSHAKKILIDAGFESVFIEEATNGAEALRKTIEAQKNRKAFRLIISDWNMPDHTGIDFLKKTRANPKIADTPFIMATSENEKEKVIEAIKLKVSNFIIKPYTSEQLMEKVDNVLYGFQKE